LNRSTSNISAHWRRLPTPSRKSSRASRTGGAAVLNRDNGQYDRLAAAAKAAGVERIVSFGAHDGADAKLLPRIAAVRFFDDRSSHTGAGSHVSAWGVPGRHLVLNSLAVLAAASLVGADLALAALALNNLKPASGRGARTLLTVPGGTVLLIDESYNANPASMRAAIALLGQAEVGKPWSAYCSTR
jgi:UDP-N-acetylmuramoyl-tripeptide--D-alanyl-D-alanine ligase